MWTKYLFFQQIASNFVVRMFNKIPCSLYHRPFADMHPHKPKVKEKSPPFAAEAAAVAAGSKKIKKDKPTASSSATQTQSSSKAADNDDCLLDTMEFGTATASMSSLGHVKIRSAGSQTKAAFAAGSKANKNASNIKNALVGANGNLNMQSGAQSVGGGNASTQQRPAVIILNDHRQSANLSSNDFTFGDFNEDEMKFFDEQADNDDDVEDDVAATASNDAAANTTDQNQEGKESNAFGTTNYLNDSGTSLETAGDLLMSSSTSADASSSPNNSFATSSQLGGVVNQSNDSGIYASASGNTITTITTNNNKLNKFLNANVAASNSTAMSTEAAGGNKSISSEACPQLETCNDIETAIIAAARAAAAEQNQIVQLPAGFNPQYPPPTLPNQHHYHNQQQYQNAYTIPRSFTNSAHTGVSMESKYPHAGVNEYNYKYQNHTPVNHAHHQRQHQNYYNTHTSRRQHYDYDCDYNNMAQPMHHNPQHNYQQLSHLQQQHDEQLRSRSSSSSQLDESGNLIVYYDDPRYFIYDMPADDGVTPSVSPPPPSSLPQQKQYDQYVVYGVPAEDEITPAHSPTLSQQSIGVSSLQQNFGDINAPAFVSKMCPNQEIEIHFRPPTVLTTTSSKHQNDVIVDFIGTAWEEVANSKVTKYYDGQ